MNGGLPRGLHDGGQEAIPAWSRTIQDLPPFLLTAGDGFLASQNSGVIGLNQETLNAEGMSSSRIPIILHNAVLCCVKSLQLKGLILKL